MTQNTCQGGVSSNRCITKTTSDEKKGDVNRKDAREKVAQHITSCTSKESFIFLYLPIAREEVLLALGTGDTRPWEERLIRFARARLCEMSATSITARTLINQLEFSDRDPHDGPMHSKGGNSKWPSWPWSAPPHEECNEHVNFLSFSGHRFHLLMELLQYAVWFNNASVPTDPSLYSAYISWGDELLQILSNLLTFHGTVPLVGYFVSAILYSYIRALVRCRNTAASHHSRDNYAGQYEELKKRTNVTDVSVEDIEAHDKTEMHSVSPHTQWETHIAILRGPLFISLITRLAQLYYPLWGTSRDETNRGSSAMLYRSLTVYTHCVPMPVFPNADEAAGHLRGLATPTAGKHKTQEESHAGSQFLWSNSHRNSIAGSGNVRENVTCVSTRKGAFVSCVFSRRTLLNIDADLNIGLKGNKDSKSANDESNIVKESDVRVSSEFLDEVVICVALADAGRLAILHGLLDLGPLPSALQDLDSNDRVLFEFMRRARRSGGYSTVGIMKSGAKIILAVEKEWQKQAESIGKEDPLPDRNTDSVVLVNNHRWMALVLREALEMISRSCCFPLDYSHQQQEEQNPQQRQWIYELKDYYYINLFLACCCVTSNHLSASLLPFTVQLTQFALSDAVLSGEGNPDQRFISVEENEAQALAVCTLCMTACRFLRLGYELGCVVSNNEHVRWLSIVLQRHVKLWLSYLRRVVLLMTVQGSTSCGKGIHSNPTATVNDVSNIVVWRALWWRTTAILECLYVLRDLFRFATTWSVVNDTTIFRTIMAELGEVLCMVCWIDMRSEGHGMIPAVVNPAVSLSPFPVMADLERRFYLGAMLVFVIHAMTDTVLAFHSWMDIREAFFSDNDDEDDNNSNNAKGSSGVSQMNLCQQKPQDNPRTCLGKGCDEIMRWIYGLYFCVLLPSGSRIHQSIALCTPDRTMIPAVQRLHQFVITNSMFHDGALYNKLGPSLYNAPRTVPSSSAAASSPSFITGILRISLDVMNSITTTQCAIMERIAEHDNDRVPSVMEYSDMLLRICEHMTLYAPWASWTSTTPAVHQVDTNNNNLPPLDMDTRVSDVKQSQSAGHSTSEKETFASLSSSSSSSMPPANTKDPSSAGTHQTNSTRLYSLANTMQSNVPFGPPPPPIYEGYFVIYAANRLLRSLTLPNFAPQKQTHLSRKKQEGSLLYVLLHRIRTLLFGLVNSLFRASDAAVYQRGLFQEQLRHGQFENSAHPSVVLAQRKEDAAKSSFLPSFLCGLTPPWSSSTAEDNAVRELRVNLESIDSYIEYHHHLLCESVTYLASAIGATQRTHWNDKSWANMESCETVSECCGAVLRLLSQQCLDTLVPDNAVPAAFQLSPLQQQQPQQRRQCAAGPISLPATSHIRDNVDESNVSSLSAAISLWWPFGDPQGAQDLESVVTSVTRVQCTALIRVMAVVASLTRTQVSAMAFAPLSLESSLTPRPLLLQENQTQESTWDTQFVVHPSTVSIGNWRKMAFSIQAMRFSESCAKATVAPCRVCRIHAIKKFTDTHENKGGTLEELCFACGESTDCDVYIRSYVEVGLPHLNRTRHDILIRRATTVEERKSLLVILLLFRRALTQSGTHVLSTPEGPSDARHRRTQATRRLTERRLLLCVAAFAFGVRQLQSAEELLR